MKKNMTENGIVNAAYQTLSDVMIDKALLINLL